MSFNVRVSNIIGRFKSGQNQLRINFRGRVVHCDFFCESLTQHMVVLDADFDWPLSCELEERESLKMEICSKHISTMKVYGFTNIYLDRLIQTKLLQVSEKFCNSNNAPLEMTIHFSMHYSKPKKSSSLESLTETESLLEEAKLAVDAVEAQQAFDRSSSKVNLLDQVLNTPKLSRASRILSMIKLHRRKKKRPTGFEEVGMNDTPRSNRSSNDSDSQSELEAVANELQAEVDMAVSNVNKVAIPPFDSVLMLESPAATARCADYQVCVTVIEARLSGPNIDPVICIQVGTQTKFSTQRNSTQCPYYNEYFVYDFHMPPSQFFDQLIILTVRPQHSEVFGSFKLDVGTAYAQPDHMFYHKWAVLMDNEDMQAGAKGYLKVDIAVVAKGETIKVTPRPEREEDENNIEANLLLPKGSSSARQQARYIVRVNSLYNMCMESSGLVANVRKALSAGTSVPTKNVFVQVSFAGHTACTATVRSSGEAEWNEQIVFAEMFPPVVRRIRLQLRSNDGLGGTVLATHFLDLTSISDEGRNGFLPTFGPTYVHMYGSSAGGLLTSKNSDAEEGVFYRGTLLMSLRVDVLDENSALVPSVQVSACLPALQNSLGVKDDFLLFGCIMNVSMLDAKVSGKQVHLQMCMGHMGNAEITKMDTASSDVSDADPVMPITSRISTPKITAQSNSEYCYVPYGDTKPCIFMRGRFQNLAWRPWHANFMKKIADNFATKVAECQFLLDCFKRQEASERFRSAIDGLISDCCQYLSYVCSRTGQTGMNKLDKERRRLSQRQIDCIASYARSLKAISNKDSLEKKLEKSAVYIQQLKQLGYEPQPPFPDLIVWLVQGQKRLAYHRIGAQDLIYSSLPDERGNYCAKLHSFYLKVPSANPKDEEAWRIKGQVTACFWFGHNSTRQGLLDGLPKGYSLTPDILSMHKPNAPLPALLEFSDKYYFELNCYLYQGRSLLASDRTGLSDPYAKVIFEGHSKTTQVIFSTLNPFWDESIKIGPVTLYGHPGDILHNPPVVVVEIFDYDNLGKGDFMGQLLAKPQVILVDGHSAESGLSNALQWHPVFRGTETGGEILGAFELIQVDHEYDDMEVVQMQNKPVPNNIKTPIPERLRLPTENYRFEVLFWGLRNLNRINLLSVDKPRVDIESNGRVLCSSSIENLSKNPNFSTMLASFDIELPCDTLYWPALSIRCVDCRSFGRDTLVGIHSIHRLSSLMYTETTNGHEAIEEPLRTDSVIIDVDGEPALVLADSRLASDTPAKKSPRHSFIRKAKANGHQEDEVQLDWWSKYFASVEYTLQADCGAPASSRFGDPKRGSKTVSSSLMQPLLVVDEHCFVNIDDKQMLKQAIDDRKAKKASKFTRKKRSNKHTNIAKLKLYTSALSDQREFEGFQDWIKTFDLFRGKETFDNDEHMRVVGRFKGAIRICHQPPGSNRTSLFKHIPNNDPILVLVRVYIVKANDLHPSDLNGKADPYLYLTLGKTKINDKENYVSKQLNPMFGKLFEIEALFPQESQLTVQVYDWDLVGRDDLIGETKIDLEDRFYSRHRATCGLAEKYETDGNNYWRDPQKPSQILTKLCRDNGIEGPFYMPGQIRVGSKTFHIPSARDQSPGSRTNTKIDTEQLALQALRNWDQVPKVGTYLVPEHVETRSLYHPDRPGIVQGKLEMWVDMFTMDVITPAPVEIAPRKPKSYELRVIIWNTDDVVLEDDAFFTGEKMSDIYVKGWIKGPEDTQSTDIHYRSLTGEGNFNWRFIFPFDYLEAEEKIVVCRKENMFSWDETEVKLPPRLELQVWDADHFSADDFLGSLSLNLTMIPRGAKTSQQCVQEMVNEDSDAPTINLFKQKRVKGWWPFVAKNDDTGEIELTGKVEAEFHLMVEDEIETNPAGFGRSEPNPLDKPNRPDSSFVWFLNPLKSMRYVLWHNYKWLMVKIIIVLLLLLMFALFIYSAPGYIMKRMIGA